MSDAPTVLVVDDEPEILASLRRTLRKESFELLTTTSPIEALQLLAERRVDLLIADIDMPELNGLELVARVRRDHPEVIRMLLTGDASLDSALSAINDGEVHRYLTKPWDKGHLRATIREALERLEELRPAGGNTRARHAAVIAALERDHPGIAEARRENGAYVVDETRIGDLIESLMTLRLDAMFDEDSDATTRRLEGRDGH